MAGDDDADGIPAVGQADRPRRGRIPDPAGQLPIGDGVAVGDVAQGVPDAPLERGADHGHRHFEPRPLPIEVRVQLVDDFGEQGDVGRAEGLGIGPMSLLIHVQTAQGAIGGHQGERPDRTVDHRMGSPGHRKPTGRRGTSPESRSSGIRLIG